MITAILATLGVIIAIVLVVVAAAYGIFKLVLGGIGMIAGGVRNGFDRVRRK